MHYFINDYTELISYCLDNYEEAKELKYSNTVRTKRSKHFERAKPGNKLITAFQLFKSLMDNVDTLIIEMPFNI